jgi:GTP pyrophosphokinase
MLEAEAKRRGYKLDDLLTEESFKNLSNKLVFDSVDEMMASIGYGPVSVNQVLFKLIDFYKKEIPKPAGVIEIEKLRHSPAGSVTVKGMGGLLVKFAHCCNPVPGDDIVGFVSRGRGVIIHRKDCPNVSDLGDDRLQPAQWTGTTEEGFVAGIKIIATDEGGVIAFVTAEISLMKLSVTQINGRVGKDGRGIIEVNIKLNQRSDLDLLINHLKKDKRIIDVYRTTQ